MKNEQDQGVMPAFSYPVKVADISANPVTVKLEADPRQLEDLAKLWQVLSVGSMKAELEIARWKKDGVRFKGRVQADIVQACVLTLDPVEARIDEPFEQIFVPEGTKLARAVAKEAAEAVLDPDAPDLPEMFSGDTIDAGPMIAEFAALAIDPYPRKPGIEFADHLEGDADEKGGKPNPFAVLKDWKKD